MAFLFFYLFIFFCMYKNLLSETIEQQRGEHEGTGLVFPGSHRVLSIWGHLGPLGPLLFTDGWLARSSDSGWVPPSLHEWPFGFCWEASITKHNICFSKWRRKKKTWSFQFSTPDNKTLHIHMTASKPGCRSPRPHSAPQTTAAGGELKSRGHWDQEV